MLILNGQNLFKKLGQDGRRSLLLARMLGMFPRITKAMDRQMTIFLFFLMLFSLLVTIVLFPLDGEPSKMQLTVVVISVVVFLTTLVLLI